MPYKDPIKAQESQKRRSKKYRLANPQKCYLATRRYIVKRNLDKRSWTDWLKESTPCMDCGHTFPSVCMDFDHRPGETKIKTISQLVCDIGASLDELFSEMKKCDLICSNCHRIRTALRQGKQICQTHKN